MGADFFKSSKRGRSTCKSFRSGRNGQQ